MQGAASTPATPLVRLGSNDPDLIGLQLDMGAMGVVLPCISTADQARTGSEACRYPPAGTRGFGPSRAAFYGFDENYFRQSNDNMLYVPIIETAEAVENIRDILAVPGVDAYVIGAYDLSISLGLPLQFEHPTFTEAVRRVHEAGLNSGKHAAVGLDTEDAVPEGFKRLFDQGFRLFLVDGDEWMLHAASRKVATGFNSIRS
jgi:4-hydroxy-2-oxoheptanedioate aldolase